MRFTKKFNRFDPFEAVNAHFTQSIEHLIKFDNLIDITVYDDKIAINLYIKPGGFPDTVSTDQEKSPTPDLNRDEALDTQITVTSKATDSTGRPVPYGDPSGI